LDGIRNESPRDTIKKICNAKDAEELIEWLRQHPLAIYEKDLDLFISHAGIYPGWSNKSAIKRSKKFSKYLRSNKYLKLLEYMYGNKPKRYSSKLSKYEKLRFTVNSFTRMRFCELDSSLNFSNKRSPEESDSNLLAWFKLPSKRSKTTRYLFGHWSSLGLYKQDNVICLDTGCVWGQKLTAYNATEDVFISVKAKEN